MVPFRSRTAFFRRPGLHERCIRLKGDNGLTVCMCSGSMHRGDTVEGGWGGWIRRRLLFRRVARQGRQGEKCSKHVLEAVSTNAAAPSDVGIIDFQVAFQPQCLVTIGWPCIKCGLIKLHRLFKVQGLVSVAIAFAVVCTRSFIPESVHVFRGCQKEDVLAARRVDTPEAITVLLANKSTSLFGQVELHAVMRRACFLSWRETRGS